MFEQAGAPENVFLRDVQAFRAAGMGALRHARLPALPPSRDISVALLQSVLSAEIICVMRYTMLAVSEDGLANDNIATEFQAQASDERRHMAILAARIRALGGVPNFKPAGLSERAAELGGSNAGFAVRLRQNLAAEQCVVEHYCALVAFFEQHDPETAAILEDILRDEEDHRSDMQDLLLSYPE
jgi:bacterioferritin